MIFKIKIGIKVCLKTTQFKNVATKIEILKIRKLPKHYTPKNKSVIK